MISVCTPVSFAYQGINRSFHQQQSSTDARQRIGGMHRDFDFQREGGSS